MYVASRSRSKFEELVGYVESTDTTMAARVKFLELDLSDMRSCIRAARRFTELEERLDILIENAALSVVVSIYTVRFTWKMLIEYSQILYQRMALRSNLLLVPVYRL